jgi:intracellular sulfur oxidation DsrE/DsrF family protein
MYNRAHFLSSLSQAGAALATFDRAAFEALAQQPYPHRQVFAARGTDADSVVEEMKNSLDAYEEDFGGGRGTLHVAAVFYGAAAPFALDDAIWSRYGLAPRVNVKGKSNPFIGSIRALMQRRASFFVCNKALTGLSISIANVVPAAQGSIDEVLGTLQAHVVAGVTIVPSGVAALNALQEAKFTYVQASL